MLNAAKTGHTKIVTSLLDWGVDINAQVLFCEREYGVVSHVIVSKTKMSNYFVLKF